MDLVKFFDSGGRLDSERGTTVACVHVVLHVTQTSDQPCDSCSCCPSYHPNHDVNHAYVVLHITPTTEPFAHSALESHLYIADACMTKLVIWPSPPFAHTNFKTNFRSFFQSIQNKIKTFGIIRSWQLNAFCLFYAALFIALWKI